MSVLVLLVLLSYATGETCPGNKVQVPSHCEEGPEALSNGANDVIVVERPDGSLASTAWLGQIGKLHSVFTSREGKSVHIFVNNIPSEARMEICESGSFTFIGSSPSHMTSNQLRQLNLKPGLNQGKYVSKDLGIVLSFTVTLLHHTDKLVITDVDGTITETDIKGHVLPRLGMTAEHKKVVELMHKIGRNGYTIVYLTARSQAQDEETRSYLFQMLQDIDGFSLPQGPVLFSPAPLLSTLVSEVVTQDPDKQKTETILDMWRAFNSQDKHSITDTVVAGYGNKDTDEKAYVNAGMSRSTIYLVDSESVVKNVGTGELTSYAAQAGRVDQLYPPTAKSAGAEPNKNPQWNIKSQFSLR